MNPHLVHMAIVAGLWALATGALAAGTTEIYQQRDADGHAVFTDRPAAKSVTERTWQLNREDPADAQQRALEVKREAAIVSERVQRIIEAQARRSSAEDMLRMRLAAVDRRYVDPYYDDGDVDAIGFVPYGAGYGPGYAPGYGAGARGGMKRGPFPGSMPSRGSGGHRAPGSVKGPAVPGNR